MDLVDLDSVLPIYVDYLGHFHGLDSPIKVMETLEQGALPQNRVVASGAEMAFTNDEILISLVPDRVIIVRLMLSRISDPVAYIHKNSSKTGLFKVVVFTEESPSYPSHNTFHAVQCLDSDPAELVELIEKLSTRCRVQGHPEKGPEIRKPPESSGKDSVRSATIRRSTAPPSAYRSQPRPGSWSMVADPVKTSETLGFEKPSFQYHTTDDLVKKDAILLNYCIGDIERFRDDLREANASNNASTNASTNADAIADANGGSVDSNEYQASDFYAIFQKFKLAFNLLAQLDGLIENPSAETILHHLFPPLAFLLDESYLRFNQDVAKEVVTPVPTIKSIQMLERCLGPGEMAIWHTFGPNWCGPKLKRECDVPPYRPRFFDGWTPGVVNFDHHDLAEAPILQDFEHRHFGSRADDDDFSDHRRASRAGSECAERESVTSFWSVGIADLVERDAQLALVMQSRNAENHKELTVTKGEYLEVVDSSRNWWRVIDCRGQAGYVPYTILKQIKFEQAQPSGKAWKNNGQDSTPITYFGNNPSPRLSHVPSPDVSTSCEQAPIPPPLPPAPLHQPQVKQNNLAAKKNNGGVAPDQSPRHDTKNYKSDTMNSVRMQSELKNVLDLFKEQKEKQTDIVVTPEVYITIDSSWPEVKQWLIAKLFSIRVLEQLAGFDGKQLFRMSKADLIAVFGKEEGKRLDSQLTVCRNRAGFTFGKSSELKQVLAEARKRIEVKNEASLILEDASRV